MRPLFLLLPCLLFACGKNGSTDATSRAAPGASHAGINSEPEHLTKAAGEQLLQSELIRCGENNSADCPGAVGLLLTKLPDGSFAQCTTFLVAPDLAITNSHCIPDDLKKAGSSCRDRGWLAFPSLPGIHAEQASCAEVLVASPLPAKSGTAVVRDYAVIRLAKPIDDRAPLVISREGLSDKENVRLTKVNPAISSDAPSMLQNIGCKAIHSSALVPDSGDDLANNMVLGDCVVVHGNSGSPILDSSGKVRGVVQFTYEAKDLDDQISANKLARFDGPLSALGGGTNFACLPFPSAVPAPALPGACASRVPGVKLTKALTDKANQLLQAKFKAGESTLAPGFGWTTEESEESTPGGRSILAVPACVVADAALPNGAIPVTLPRAELLSGSDRYFVQDVKVNDLEPVPASLRSHAEKDGTAVEIRGKQGEVLFAKTLAPCGA